MKKQYYCSIDVAKVICAILIVFIHTEPFSSVNARLNSITVNYLCRIAVPFFFISSGFLLFSKMDLSEIRFDLIRKYVVRILKLYLFWSIVYFSFTAAQMYWTHDSGRAWQIFVNWLKNMVFSSGYGFLWYLPATIVAVLLVSLLLKCKIPLKGVIAACFVLYLIGLCGQSYYGLAKLLPISPGIREAIRSVYRVITTTRNGVFEGALFIALGAQIAHTDKKKRFSVNVVGLIISYVLLFLEVMLVSKMEWRLEYDMYLFLIPCAYYTMKVVLGFQKPLPQRLCKVLRSYSSLIYLTHMLTADFISLFCRVKLHSLAFFGAVFVSTLLISTVIYLLSQTKHFDFLKNIY